MNTSQVAVIGDHQNSSMSDACTARCVVKHPYGAEWSIAHRAGEVVLAMLVWGVAPICGIFVASWCVKRWGS